MTLKTNVTINGTSVVTPTNYLLNYEVEDTITDEMTTAELKFDKRILASIDLDAGMDVIVTRGLTTASDNYIFRGEVTNVEKDGPYVVVQCLDKLYQTERLIAHKTYDITNDTQLGKISAIAQDLIETYAGMTANVTDSGTTFTIKKFPCVRDSIFERLRRLAEALGWIVYYSPVDDKVHFEPAGTTVFGTTFVVGGSAANVINVPVWEYVYDEMANDIYLYGDIMEPEAPEFFNGNASDDTFNLAQKPEGIIKVWVGSGVFDPTTATIPSLNNNNLKVVNVPGTAATTAFDCYAEPDLKKVIFNSTSIPPAGTNNVEIRYQYKRPTPIHVQDDASIAAFKRYTSVKFFPSLTKVEDVELLASQLLAKYKRPLVHCTVEVQSVHNIYAGYQVRVIDNLHNEDRNLTVQSITYRYPETTDLLELGDKPYRDEQYLRNAQERIEALEREYVADSTAVLERRDFTHNIKIQRRYLEVIEQDISGDSTYGRATYGTSAYDGTYAAAAVTQRIVWPDQTYEERFIDTSFKDAANTDANWDTTNNYLEF